MIIKDNSFKPIVLDRKLPEFENICTLQFLEGDKVVDEITHKNTVTGFAAGLINQGNFYNSIPTNKMFPIAPNFDSGVMLIDKNGDATKLMIPGDANVIACANNVSGSDSTDLRRGNYNPDSSGPIIGENGRVIGYKNVWYWPDTRGNCAVDQKIKAVVLTRPTLAIARYSDSMPPDTTLSELLIRIETTSTLATCQIIDYENNCAFNISVSSGKIVIKQYQLDTDQYHVVGVYNSSGVYDVTRLITTQTITPQTAITNFDANRASVSYKNGILHLLEWQNNSSTVIDHAIDISDWSETSTSYTYSLGTGVYIKPISQSDKIICKDVILYTSTHLWLVGTDNNFYKCSLAQVADVTEYDSVYNNTSYINGVFEELPNGDWVKFAYGQDNVARKSANYYHNGEVYGAYDVYDSWYGYGDRLRAVNQTGYGTAIHSYQRDNNWYLSIYAPVNHISTVWNIDDDDHEKNAGLTMRCVYEIRERVQPAS